MTDTAQRIHEFVAYAARLKGDEKGEAQVYCDRLFQAFGHDGYKEAGAMLEHRVKRRGKGTGFADLFWESRLLLEMKKRGEPLQKHYQQAFEYWLELTPHRPKYVVLCNFDEFWIYDLDEQLYEPVDRILLADLPNRYSAFNFLFPVLREPLFNNNRVSVTRAAAAKVAGAFNSLVARGESRTDAQRFILQCVVAMFAEDCELLPQGLFLDKAVRAAYGMKPRENVLRFLLRLNEAVAEREAGMKKVTGPGLPRIAGAVGEFITDDCVRIRT